MPYIQRIEDIQKLWLSSVQQWEKTHKHTHTNMYIYVSCSRICLFYMPLEKHRQSEIYAWVDKALAHLPVLSQTRRGLKILVVFERPFNPQVEFLYKSRQIRLDCIERKGKHTHIHSTERYVWEKICVISLLCVFFFHFLQNKHCTS